MVLTCRQDQSEAETQGWPRGLCQGHGHTGERSEELLLVVRLIQADQETASSSPS